MIRTYILPIIAAIFTAFFISFAIANRAAVAVDLFPFGYAAELPLFLIMVACLLLGIVLGCLAAAFKMAQLKLQCRKERQRSFALESELQSFRTQRPPTLLPPAA